MCKISHWWVFLLNPIFSTAQSEWGLGLLDVPPHKHTHSVFTMWLISFSLVGVSLCVCLIMCNNWRQLIEPQGCSFILQLPFKCQNADSVHLHLIHIETLIPFVCEGVCEKLVVTWSLNPVRRRWWSAVVSLMWCDVCRALERQRPPNVCFRFPELNLKTEQKHPVLRHSGYFSTKPLYQNMYFYTGGRSNESKGMMIL